MSPDPKKVVVLHLLRTAASGYEIAAQPLKSRYDYGEKPRQEEAGDGQSVLPGDEPDEDEEEEASF